MKLLVRNIWTLVFMLSVHMTLFCSEVPHKQLSKLHPFLRSAIGKPNQSLHKLAQNISTRYNVIIYTKNAGELNSSGIRINSKYSEFVTAQLTKEQILQVSDMESVRYITPGKKMLPQIDVSVPETGASLLHSGFINNTSYKGNGAIVLIYDTGIDWKHLDFRKSDTTKSRILCIWDQTDTIATHGNPPAGFTYGVEYSQLQIENELSGLSNNTIHEEDINGHGTHVASTATGNGLSNNQKYIGMAPEADIIAVKGGDYSFDETNMIDCLTYAQNKAAEYGKPIVVNWSIGGQDGAHDGTSPSELAIDEFVRTPGRAVCVSAGNDAIHLLHFNGIISPSSPDTIQINVPIYLPNKDTEDDYFYISIWLPDSQAVTATVKSPSNITFTSPINTDTICSNSSDGTIEVWNHVSATNSHREIAVYVFDSTAQHPPRSGKWTVTLSMTSGSVQYDCWLADSDVGGSGVSLVNGNNNKTVGTPATSRGAITVASYATKWYWPTSSGVMQSYGGTDQTQNISYYSSIGPAADGRQKPDVAAPGQAIIAALSRNVDTTNKWRDIVITDKYQRMQGTSMAAPHCTGASALLLGAHPNLTAEQIKSLLTSTANSDSYTANVPNYYWGYGKLDILEAMAKSFWNTANVTRNVLSYDGSGSNNIVTLSGSEKYAVRFTPTTNGKVTGIQINLPPQISNPIIGDGVLICEIFSNNNGNPGSKIDNSVSRNLALLSPTTNNYIQWTDTSAKVISEEDFFVVISVNNPSDTIKILNEDISSGNRTMLFDGSNWSTQTYNLRIRSIITSTSGLASIGQSFENRLFTFQLNQNFPNPFNISTTIEYQIPYKGMTNLKVFDLLGRQVKTLIDVVQDGGTYRVQWDGKSEDGVVLSSGVYYYQIEYLPTDFSGTLANHKSTFFKKSGRMVLLK